MSISLDSLDSSLHSVEIKNASGDALAISASGELTISNTSFAVTATNLDIRDLLFASDSVDVSGSSVLTSPNAVSTWKSTAETVTNTAGELVSTPLAGRSKIIIQNLGTQDIYIGPDNAVTTVNGTKIPKGSSFTIDFEDDANVFAITGASTSDVRISEYAV